MRWYKSISRFVSIICCVEEEKVVKETPNPEVFIERVGDVKDSYDKKYKLFSYRNQWDNNQGFVYITAPTKQHRKNSDTYENVLGVAHFLLDASVDPKNPVEQYRTGGYVLEELEEGGENDKNPPSSAYVKNVMNLCKY